jgi:hypothetical protein
MRNPFNFEAEPFEFYSEFDEYEGGQPAKPCRCNRHSTAGAELFEEYHEEQADAYSEFDGDLESDFEEETFEIYPEYDGAYEMEKDPDFVEVGAGRAICGVLWRDFKKMYDSLADLWEDLTKKARAALSEDVARIEGRLRGGWYAREGCKESDFQWFEGKARGMTSDKELKEDESVQKMSKRLSHSARQASEKARQAAEACKGALLLSLDELNKTLASFLKTSSGSDPEAVERARFEVLRVVNRMIVNWRSGVFKKELGCATKDLRWFEEKVRRINWPKTNGLIQQRQALLAAIQVGTIT